MRPSPPTTLPPEVQRGLTDVLDENQQGQPDYQDRGVEYGAPNLHPIQAAQLLAGRVQPTNLNDAEPLRQQYDRMTVGGRDLSENLPGEPVFRGEATNPGRPMTDQESEDLWLAGGEGGATVLARGGRPARLAQNVGEPTAQRAEIPVPAEPAGLVIPDIPPELLGPTGRVFIHPNGRDYSTELGAVVQVPGQAGKFAATPLLVPGQTGIADLLAGKRATPDQLGRATAYLGQRLQGGESVPIFNSPQEAVQAEQARHREREQQLAPYVRPHLKQDWRLDYQDRFGVDPDRLGLGQAEGKRELRENWYVDPKAGRPFLGKTNPEPGKTWRLVFSDRDLAPAWDERGQQGFPLLIQRTDLKRPDWPKLLEAARVAQYEHPDARLDTLRLLGPDAATAVPRWTVVPHPSGQGFTVAPGDFGGQVQGEWGPAQFQAASDRVNRLAAGGAVFPSYQTKDEAWDAVRAHIQATEDMMRAEERHPLPRQAVDMQAQPGEWPTDEAIAARKAQVDEQVGQMKTKNPKLYERLPLLHPTAGQ